MFAGETYADRGKFVLEIQGGYESNWHYFASEDDARKAFNSAKKMPNILNVWLMQVLERYIPSPKEGDGLTQSYEK